MVLVVLALLSLGAYTFSEFMIVEAQATALYGQDAQARALADSGIELAASLLMQRYEVSPATYYNNPAWFQGVLVQDSETDGGRGRFSIIAPVESDLTGTAVRFGLMDESAKININALLKTGLSNEEARNLLLGIPDMTIEIADAILDFIDTDTSSREFGAEDEYYLTLSPPYATKNGRLDSLDELLLVRGMTPLLLYGEDANRNGLLDAAENDGDQSYPLDNGDGTLQRGWSNYFTVFSREANLRADGLPKINVNGNALADLYDQVALEFDEDTAKFLVAYRMSGAAGSGGSSGSGGGSLAGGGGSGSGGGSSGGSSSGRGGSGGGSSGGSSGGASGGSQLGAVGGGLSGAGVTETTARDVSGAVKNSMKVTTSQDVSNSMPSSVATTTPQKISAQQGVQQLANTISATLFSSAGSVTRGGIDVTKGGSVQVKSLYELIGASAQVQIAGKNTTLNSPWSSDSSDMASYLPVLMDKLTTNADEYIEGRINVNLARREILMGIPGMTDTLADAIVGAQVTGSASTSLGGTLDIRGTTGWLVTDGLTDLATLQKLDPYLTARGDVYRLQSVGYFDGRGPMARIEAVIDGTQYPPQVIFQRDLTDLGRGYSAQLLTTGAGATQ